MQTRATSARSARLLGGPRRRPVLAPTASQTLRVEADERVEGVTLVAAEPPADADEATRLLHEFSPDFVLFPDADPKAAPPFMNGRHDYHPRTVEAFLDGASPFIAAPGGALAVLYVAVVVALVAGLGALILAVAVLRFDLAAPVGAVLGAGAVVGTGLGLVLRWIAPRGMAELRAIVARGDDTTRIGIRRQRLDLPDPLWAIAAWNEYRDRIVTSPAHPRASYGRVVDRGTDRYLQYWQFYVFNDWHNRHEADWELVVVRVSRDGTGWVPRAAAYSSHFGGHWRSWADVETRDGRHPVVYVAKGSHAQYFESLAEGYRATLTTPLELLELRIRLTVQNDWTDVVAKTAGPIRHPYEIRVIPAELDPGSLGATDVERWWWLAFDGLWGGRDAISGPVSQGLKWTDPPAWVRMAVDRDVDDLEDFARVGEVVA